MPLTDIFTHIDAHRDEYIQRLIKYVSQPSISAHGVGIAETAAFLAELLGGLGMRAEVLPTAGWPMVFAELPGPPGTPTVLLYGHYDVQPPDPLELWHSPPFEPQIRNGRMYGRGVGDNKGQHLAQILAVEATLAVRGSLPEYVWTRTLGVLAFVVPYANADESNHAPNPQPSALQGETHAPHRHPHPRHAPHGPFAGDRHLSAAGQRTGPR
jgi:hypothetical protein